VTAEIDVTSLNTGNEQRDGHVKSADFFDAEHYPAATFASTAVRPNGEAYILDGNREAQGPEPERTAPALRCRCVLQYGQMVPSTAGEPRRRPGHLVGSRPCWPGSAANRIKLRSTTCFDDTVVI
jgi:YceI-like domain